MQMCRHNFCRYLCFWRAGENCARKTGKRRRVRISDFQFRIWPNHFFPESFTSHQDPLHPTACPRKYQQNNPYFWHFPSIFLGHFCRIPRLSHTKIAFSLSASATFAGIAVFLTCIFFSALPFPACTHSDFSSIKPPWKHRYIPSRASSGLSRFSRKKVAKIKC